MLPLPVVAEVVVQAVESAQVQALPEIQVEVLELEVLPAEAVAEQLQVQGLAEKQVPIFSEAVTKTLVPQVQAVVLFLPVPVEQQALAN